MKERTGIPFRGHEGLVGTFLLPMSVSLVIEERAVYFVVLKHRRTLPKYSGCCAGELIWAPVVWPLAPEDQ
jgi:hypothetical protein